MSFCLSFGLSADLNFHNYVFYLVFFVKLVIFIKKYNVLKLWAITSTKVYAHSSVCPSLSLSVCPSIHWFPHNYFAGRVNTNIASDLC